MLKENQLTSSGHVAKQRGNICKIKLKNIKHYCTEFPAMITATMPPNFCPLCSATVSAQYNMKRK
jgi:hypothetical protein